MTQDYDDTDAMLNEMMARGAAEQRLKDAERQEPVAWQKQHLNGTWSWTACHEAYEANGVPTRGLYTHPANVAALEARVKELEAAITTLFDGQAVLENRGWDKNPDRVVLYDDERMASGKDPVDAAIRGAGHIRAALIREGGV